MAFFMKEWKAYVETFLLIHGLLKIEVMTIMGDFLINEGLPPPYVQFSIHMHIVLIPYIDYVLVIFMGMDGGRREGMYVPYGMNILHVTYVTYFRENIGKTMFVSCDLFSPYGMGYLHLMRNLEEQVMEGWFGEHLAYGGSLTHVCVTKGGIYELQHSPYQ